MYTREQASKIRHSFWTSFGYYMSPQLSAEGGKVNWLNYNTKVKNVYFRMDANQKCGTIGIEITHGDLGIQELFFEQFQELKTFLHEKVGEEWKWLLHTPDPSGRIISRIYNEVLEVNIFDEGDWPKLISFFKPRIIALDEFWSDAKYTFESLK